MEKHFVSLLYAEKNVPVEILLKGKKKDIYYPIFHSSESKDQSKGKKSFIPTEIFSESQHKSFDEFFNKHAVPKMDNPKISKCKWECIYEDTTTPTLSGFSKFAQTISQKENMVIILHVTINGQKAVFGGFCNTPMPTMGSSWMQEYDYQIPYHQSNFVFYY